MISSCAGSTGFIFHIALILSNLYFSIAGGYFDDEPIVTKMKQFFS